MRSTSRVFWVDASCSFEAARAVSRFFTSLFSPSIFFWASLSDAASSFFSPSNLWISPS